MSQAKSPIPIRLFQARTEKGLSQKMLGIEAGVDPSSASPRINQYETGKHTPDINMLRQLANVLNVPIAFFYCDDDLIAEVIVMLYRNKIQDAIHLINQNGVSE